MRRNDELALLYEKIKLQQSVLNKGEAQYTQRQDEIKKLNTTIQQLQAEIHSMKTGVSNVDTLRNEVFALQRELLQEKTKVKALSEELENPVNVHRWRKLEGADPATADMITKIQTLQKRLLAVSEDIAGKDAKLAEQDKLLNEYRDMLARKPGPESAGELAKLQTLVRDKTQQLKAMTGELAMYSAKVKDLQDELDTTGREMDDIKKKYFESKRKEQMKRCVVC